MDKRIVGIDARKYKVNQTYNDGVYFIESLNLTGQFGWYVSYYGEKIQSFLQKRLIVPMDLKQLMMH